MACVLIKANVRLSTVAIYIHKHLILAFRVRSSDCPPLYFKIINELFTIQKCREELRLKNMLKQFWIAATIFTPEPRVLDEII